MCLSLLNSFFRWLWRFFSEIYCAVVSRIFSNQKLEEILTSKRNASKASRNQKIEEILRTYPNELVQSFSWDTGDETEAAEAILEDSVVEGDKRWDLSKTLAHSLRQIKGYQKLCMKVEERRLESYCSNCPEHEWELLRLWKLLKSEEPLTGRRSEQWQEIGFQGDDPATDFRGMGMLGLDQLVFFAQFDTANCHRVLSLSYHPTIGFPFTVCGITITALCKELLFDNLLKNHFYNALEQPPLGMDHFHQVYCRVFILFADFWVFVRPSSVMEFNVVKHRFVEHLERYLRRLDANLLNASLEDLEVSAAKMLE
uniref:ELMO domain-containing protein n=1 Tax=Globodera rostochiensis TaxID=31243 RepID=A0A914GWU0_GLORO